MRRSVSAFGCLVLIFAASHTGLAGEDKKKPDEAPQEQTVVDYDSKTHGAVQVKSVNKEPTNSFDVLRDGKALGDNPKLLNGTWKLEPGTYEIEVNRTRRKVKVEAGKKTILLTGELVVESEREVNSWIPKQGKETRLAANPPLVNRGVALFPGTYTVYLDLGVGLEPKNLGDAEVRAGKKTVVKE